HPSAGLPGDSRRQFMTQATDQEKRAAIDGFYAAFSDKDLESLPRVVSGDWEYIPDIAGGKPGADRMVGMFATIASAFPDLNVEIIDVLIAGDRVGVRARVKAT